MLQIVQTLMGLEIAAAIGQHIEHLNFDRQAGMTGDVFGEFG